MSAPAGAYPTLSGAGAERLVAGAERIAVVGAGGWLGLATLEALHGLLGEAFGGRVVCFGSSERVLILRGGLTVPQAPLAHLARLAPMPTLVLHLAFLTQEKAKDMPAAAYAGANAAIGEKVFAALTPIGARAVFVASSGAVHLVDDPAAEPSKRLYGRLKLADEARVAAWAGSSGGRAVIGRLFNLSGPYINKRSSYALASFIADAQAGRPISIRAKRPVLRSYVAINELMSVVFAALTESGNGVVQFDTAGDREYEMGEIAEAVQEALGVETSVDRPALAEGAPDRYLGDAATYRGLRRRAGVETVEFDDQIRQTARFMAECGESR